MKKIKQVFSFRKINLLGKNNKRLSLLLLLLILFLLSFILMLVKREEIATTLAIRYYGANSQCIGYVQRYYRNMFDVEIVNIGRAQNLFDLAGDYGLYAHSNGGNVYPQPGDILVFGHRNGIGHVSIITEVFEDGVKIIEQNWGTSGITTNGNRPLKMNVTDGNFFIEDRNDYWVIGWVSRIGKNPNKQFIFPEGQAEGWYPDGHLLLEKENAEGLKAKIVGRSPVIASPVFIDGRAIKDAKKIEFRMKIENNKSQIGQGRLFLRDKEGNWSQDIPFAVEANKGFRIYSVNLENLPKDLEITQIRLQLNDQPEIRKESWTISWFQIY
jgi:hypothetical protein